jgi:hypothetical protein
MVIEVESAIAEGRPTGFAFHPEVIGRALKFARFEAFVRTLNDDPGITFACCADIGRSLIMGGLDEPDCA